MSKDQGFSAERQALAMMDHPNIARVLDGGATETGRLYLVMELVRGIPITQYCDDNHLFNDERIELFILVCHAIQHAHQKGIIHCDLKPSNILITLQNGVPVPRVIDFGIAKATEGQLSDATLHTQLLQSLGTPAYMSPEQAELRLDSLRDIDTRSDIYSLGVLLYELLTGQTPFDFSELIASGLDEMRRIIREVEPKRPSYFTNSQIKNQKSRIDSDLDWIVMKCLEKDRARRYETASGLAKDIERFIKEEPITARPPRTTYKIRKFIGRNKAMVNAGATIAAVLILGTGISTWQAIRATRAQGKLIKQSHLSTQLRYEAEMALAFDSLTSDNLSQAHELLRKQEPEANRRPSIRKPKSIRAAGSGGTYGIGPAAISTLRSRGIQTT